MVRHPDAPPGAIHALEADLERVPGGVRATFRAIGDMSRLVIPGPSPRMRTDGLWRTTCFELFVGGEGAAYREFNLSPSGAWAAYGFDRYRHGMHPVEAAIEIETSMDSKAMILVARIMSEVPDPAGIGLTAVIEEADGLIRYWSMAFAPGKPDFHAAAVRSLILDGVSAQ